MCIMCRIEQKKEKMMKKLLIPALTLVLALILLIACGEATVEKAFINEYDYVGELHNEGLDYVLLELESAIEERVNITDSEKNVIINEAVKEFSASKNCSYDFSIDHVYSIVSSITQDGNSLNKVLSEEINYQDSLTNNQNQLISEFFEIYNESVSYESFISSINDFEVEADNILMDEEKEAIFSMTSVAEHSANYWQENMDKWEAILSEANTGLNKRSADWGQWRSFIISDLTGALIGSIVLGPAGAIPYAIVGSVTETVRQIDQELTQ